MGEIIKITKQLFEGWVVILFLLLYTALGTLYGYKLTENILFSIILGLSTSFVIFYTTNVINKQIDNEQKELDNINKYVAIMVANLKTGSNVLESLKFTYDKVDKVLQEPIQKSIDSVLVDGELNLDEFEKFGFLALDIFHKNLLLMYAEGGNPAIIFKTTTEDINQELQYRDKLKRFKNYTAKEEYLSLGIVMAIPLILSFNDAIYKPLLDVPILPYVLTAFMYVSSVAIYYFINKCKKDVKVTL